MDVVTILLLMFFLAIELVAAIFTVFLIKKGGLWDLMWLRLFNGSLYILSHPDNTIEFKRSGKPRQTIEFPTVDKAGNKKKYSVQISRVKHALKGTSMPIHFVPFNNPENVNINDREESAFSVQQWNEYAITGYQTGWNARNAMLNKNPLNIENIQLILMVAIILVLVLNAWFTYNVLGAVGGA